MIFQLPVIEGLLDRRILLNYRFDPEYLSKYLPKHFSPRLYKNYGVGGICMIRFLNLRPKHFPEAFGINSENAAHRIAVRWTHEGRPCEGVFIPQRDTASAFNYWTGGRIFPGVFRKSQFSVTERDGRYRVEISNIREKPHVIFDGSEVSTFSTQSIFPSLDDASDFFAKGAIGYSAAKDRSHYQGMELRLLEWDIRPLEIHEAYVQLYQDGTIFPKTAVQLDSAMVMKRLKHEWHNIPVIPA